MSSPEHYDAVHDVFRDARISGVNESLCAAGKYYRVGHVELLSIGLKPGVESLIGTKEVPRVILILRPQRYIRKVFLHHAIALSSSTRNLPPPGILIL